MELMRNVKNLSFPSSSTTTRRSLHSRHQQECQYKRERLNALKVKILSILVTGIS
jgi:hypothetical protein